MQQIRYFLLSPATTVNQADGDPLPFRQVGHGMRQARLHPGETFSAHGIEQRCPPAAASPLGADAAPADLV